jgi:uncharacterized glyoxalase superfamily protein PhnB
MMLANRSMPAASVIPELAYPDVASAADWLCKAFGFTRRLTIGNHRVQLNAEGGAVVVTERPPGMAAGTAHGVLVRVEDVDAHRARAVAAGANVLSPPEDYPYGERQYTVEDPGGHRWTFSQSATDVDPRSWGGLPGNQHG